MPHPRPTVLQATWNWRNPDRTQAERRPSLRRTAVQQALVTGLVAAVLQFGLGHVLFGRIVAGMAVVVLLLGLFLPAAYRPVHRLGQVLGRAVGTALVYLLLVPFFGLCFVPVALWLRLQGRDPLHRTWRDRRWTYWIRRPRRARDLNIDRQFLLEDRAARSERREVGSLPDREPRGRS